MLYGHTLTAEFVSRPNRFVAIVMIDGMETKVHVKNTGRCKEILVPGAKVVLEESDNPDRKYGYDLIAAYKGDMLVNIDSQAPNKAFHEYILSGKPFGDTSLIRPEFKHGDSRFDFYVESGDRRIFVEVKGVTLEFDGLCMFPDAPTERGLKHVRGLERCVEEGYEAYVAFVIQMEGMREFTPNSRTDPDLAEELSTAEEVGVGIMCLECDVTENSMMISGSIPYRL